MIDSHCHIDCDAYLEDREEALARAAAAGIGSIVVPAVDEPSWRNILELTRRTEGPRCHAALGIHPVALPKMPPDQDEAVLDRLSGLVAKSHPVAIGECGIDTTIDLKLADLPRQERMLGGQVRIARNAGLPLVLHARGPGCYERLYQFLAALPASWTGVIHSYGGGIDLLKKYVTLPVLFGFAGPATYLSARKVKASIAAVPEDRLLVETDSPDQTPEPHRPGRNEPAYLIEIVRGIAAARGSTVEEIERISTENARRLFGPAL